MRRHSLSCLCIFASAIGMAAPVASADVIIGNLSAGAGLGTVFGSGSTTQYKAFGFTMGSTAYFLDSVDMSMNFTQANPLPILAIWSGAGAPQTELLVLNNPAVMSGPGLYNFTVPSSFVLQANTTYWVRLQSDPPTQGPSFTWDGTDPSTMPSGPGASANGFVFNGNPSTFLNRLQVNGTVVPAPGVLALIGVAIGFAPRRRSN